MDSTSAQNLEDAGVYDLLTELCNKTAQKYCSQNRISLKLLTSKMRSLSYEIILKKTSKEFPANKRDPIIDLLTHYFVSHQNTKNVAEYKRSSELKKIISKIRQTDFGENKEIVYNILRFLNGLCDAVKLDLSPEIFQNPFTFGLLDEMLPKPGKEIFGSPQPYPYFPSHVFELPFSLKRQGSILDNHRSQTYTEYTVESFESPTYSTNSPMRAQTDLKTFLSPMSFASLTSSHLSSFYDSKMLNYPRLTEPRDLQIPTFESNDANMKISLTSTDVKSDIKEVYRARNNVEAVDIWELATQIDKDVPENIWEIVSKLPPINERQLIATSPREVGLWRRTYEGVLTDLNVISEKHFIRHLMYLIIGIETSSFPFNQETNSFYMKEHLVLEGISREHIKGYVSDLLLVGTYYRRLYNFAFNQTSEDHLYSHGLVYEAARDVIKRYLLEFRLLATDIYEECSKSCAEGLNCMPTLLQILFHMEPLKYEIETIVAIYKMIDSESKSAIPRGAELMSYLFNEISLVTHKKTALTMFNSLYSICKVYFKFIERFIFEGELDDRYNEFFIRKDNQYVSCRSKRYWDKGFHITQNVAVPEFLKSLSKFILLCGKSLRLLKLCNPNDPLVLLISSDHPTVKCCASFEELERQQQVLDVYRTRCLFVSGELVTFDQILLKREAERKAFTEMASQKQAETLEKIVAERKRLAQLIIAEKQHSLRVLEAAMAEAKAAKNKAKQRERKRHEIEHAAEKATEEVDSRLRDDERNKIMEYYSKLNMEVEKSKMHTEWKIKRLQLDQSRMQLLSTEERNLKREKLELEHQRNEENIMAMSIQSDFNNDDHDSKEESEYTTANCIKDDENQVVDSKSSVIVIESEETKNMEFSENSDKAQGSTDVFSALCNVAKSIFGVSKTTDKSCDNKKNLDAQGNVIPINTEVNSNVKNIKTSNEVIGGNLDNVYDNLQYQNAKQEAFMNKQKVMAHEFGQIDKENNQLKDSSHKTFASIDEENNVNDVMSSFTEAKRNKLKVLGTGYDLNQRKTIEREPATDAQREALYNKQKVLGSESDLAAEIHYTNEITNVAQEAEICIKRGNIDEENNVNEVMSSFGEAKRNKLKVLGADFGLNQQKKIDREPITDAQKEALINKQKVLGVEYNLPAEIHITNEPANVAQEEAIRNKNKVLGLEYDRVDSNLQASSKRESVKRSGLTLNLKPYGETIASKNSLKITPNTGAITPGDFFPGLDLETPTTADMQLEGPMSSNIFTPQSEAKDFSTGKPKSENEYLTSEGFNFPMMVNDDTAESEAICDINTVDTPDNSPSKTFDIKFNGFKTNNSFFNLLDGTYSLEEFDPFCIKELKRYSNDHFTSKMDLEMTTSCYTHPAVIMEEVKKKPSTNIFASHFGSEQEDHQKISCDNIATLTACLQRSVMLPLTYQLEVVNNSILTYFLVNFDMYEHLRSLKDYFFLMDGEFSKSICHNLFTKLVKTLNPQELLNFATLHNILDKALGSSISHVQKFSENLSFTITECPLSFQHSSPDVLQCLSLTYSVSWPLNIILSQEALLRYAKVFQFLVKMRRIFWVLGEDFEALKLSAKLSRQHSRKLLRSPHYISIQIYRHVMASMIRAVDNYIVTTCILSSWTEFENDLKKARTLDDLYDCHVVYIKKVLFRCLLNNRSTPVMKLLNDMFTVILKFSRVLKAGEWQQNEDNGYFINSNFAQLEELFHLFEKLAKYLHKVVTKLMECGYQRHLVELLTMINLNGFYDLDKSKEEH